MDKDGVLLCAKYAACPNFFGYCGPDKSSSVLDHLKEEVGDEELKNILSEFQTLFPYLCLIAQVNKVADPFNRRVVEAYWIGNELLKKVNPQMYRAFLDELLSYRKKVSREVYQMTNLKIFNHPVFPHHSFHVFNIFKNYARKLTPRVLKVMDECRIGWGKVQAADKKLKIKNYLNVRTRPLATAGSQLTLGTPVVKEIKADYQKKEFNRKIKPGDWISFHWGFACDVLTLRQIHALEYYTQNSINYFNQPLV